MKIEDATVETFSLGTKETAVARIQASAKAFEILSSSLYSNSILAIIRELAANAKDSHVASKKPDAPFDIQLPNKLDPQFKVRDYGTGMSHEFVMTRVNTYFDSTKNDSNDEIGGFGLGMKSVFSYTTSFIISCFDGTARRVYAYQIGSGGLPEISFLAETPSDEPAGVEISVPVMDVDYQKFKENAIEALSFYTPRPNITGCQDVDFEPKVMFEGSNWVIYKNPGHFKHDRYVEMGNVIYPVLENSEFETTRHYRHHRQDTILIFKAGIGEIDITPNREQIKLTDRTNNQVKMFAETVRAELAAKVQAELDAETGTFWEVVISERVESIRNNSHFYDRFGIKVNTFTYKGRSVTETELRYTAKKEPIIRVDPKSLDKTAKKAPTRIANLVKKAYLLSRGYDDNTQRRDVQMDYYGLQFQAQHIAKTKVIVGSDGFGKKLTQLQINHLRTSLGCTNIYMLEANAKNVQTIIADIKERIVDFDDVVTWNSLQDTVKDVKEPDIFFRFKLEDGYFRFHDMPKLDFKLEDFAVGSTVYYGTYNTTADGYHARRNCSVTNMLGSGSSEHWTKLLAKMNGEKDIISITEDQLERLTAAGVNMINIQTPVDEMMMEYALVFIELKPTMSLKAYMEPMSKTNEEIVPSTHYKALKYWARMSGDTDFYELLLRLNDESTSSYRPSEADQLCKALGKMSIKDFIAKHNLKPKKATSNQIVKDIVAKAPLVSMLVTRYNNPLVVQYVEQQMGWDKKNLDKKKKEAKKA